MKRSRIEEMSIEVTVGAFMFMILLALGFFTIILSRENMFKKTYPIDIVFESVMGLREGDNVFVKGVDVGKIKTLTVEEEGVHLVANLEIAVNIHEDYRVEILPSSVLGGRYLHLYEGSKTSPILPEGTVLVGLQPIDLIDEASETIMLVKNALDEGGVLDNLKATMEQFKIVTTRLSEGKGTLGKLLAEDDIYDELHEIVSNLNEVSQRLSDGKGTLGKLMAEDDRLYEDLAGAASAIKELTTSMNEGEGTIGKLVKDDAVYEELQMLLHEIRATVDDYRETSPISTFTTILFGAF